jgi:hypothetical protein
MTIWIIRVLMALTAFGQLRLATAAETNEPSLQDPVLGTSIVAGTMLDGRLWLLGETGGLVAFDLNAPARDVIFEHGVAALRKNGDELWILRSRNPIPEDQVVEELVLSIWHQGRFADLPPIEPPEGPIGLSSFHDRPVVVLRRSIQIPVGDRAGWRSVRLQQAIRGALYHSTLSATFADHLYVGTNLGEWGGGMQQVNLANGRVVEIEARRSNDLCDGILVSECHPVTEIIADPQNPDCILATVGFMHMLQSGGILRVCGTNMEVVFEKKIPFRIDTTRTIETTEAFFGLAAAKAGGYWALGSRTLRHFQGGQVIERPLPRLEPLLGIPLTRGLPGVIVLATTFNWSMSVSGYTPLLVPLE